METLNDLILKTTRIREAIDMIDVKGHENWSFAKFAYDGCNELISTFRALIRESEKLQNGEHEERKERELNGEPDSGIPG